jgi:hypothetical protein
VALARLARSYTNTTSCSPRLPVVLCKVLKCARRTEGASFLFSIHIGEVVQCKKKKKNIQ